MDNIESYFNELDDKTRDLLLLVLVNNEMTKTLAMSGQVDMNSVGFILADMINGVTRDVVENITGFDFDALHEYVIKLQITNVS